MSRLQTLRMIACMLLMGVVAIAAYLFYQHSLYFCLFFSLMIMAGIIIYICQWQYKTTRIWGIERSGFFNGREKWAKGFENQRV